MASQIFFFFKIFMWTIFKVFIEFVTILLLCFGFLALRYVGSLLPDQIEPTPPAFKGEVLTTGPPRKSLARYSWKTFWIIYPFPSSLGNCLCYIRKNLESILELPLLLYLSVSLLLVLHYFSFCGFVIHFHILGVKAPGWILFFDIILSVFASSFFQENSELILSSYISYSTNTTVHIHVCSHTCSHTYIHKSCHMLFIIFGYIDQFERHHLYHTETSCKEIWHL